MDEETKRKIREGGAAARERRRLQKELDEQAALAGQTELVERKITDDIPSLYDGLPPKPLSDQGPKPVHPDDEPNDELRDKLLANIDPAVAALFTDDEIRAIVKKATDDALGEKKKQALKQLTDRARVQARVEQGLVSQDVIRTAEEQARMDELVTWRCNLPEGGGLGLRIDGKLIRHGEVVVTTRAEFASALNMMYQSWRTEFRFKGLNPYNQMRDFQSPEITTGAVN